MNSLRLRRSIRSTSRVVSQRSLSKRAALACSLAAAGTVALVHVPSAQAALSLGRPLSSGASSVSVNFVAPGDLYSDHINQLDLRVAVRGEKLQTADELERVRTEREQQMDELERRFQLIRENMGEAK